MLFLIVLAFITSSYLFRDVTTTGESNKIQSQDQEIIKRSDGLMHELVNLLVDEKYRHKETKKMIDKMVQQNKGILEQFAGFHGKLLNERTKVIQFAAEIEALKKGFAAQNRNINNARNTIHKIKEKIGNFNNKEFILEINKKTTLLSKQLESHANKISRLYTAKNIKNGAVYIRWGKTRCPSRDAKLVYSGYAAGAYYNQNAGSDAQCLPKNPNWGRYSDGDNPSAYIYGAEYQLYFSVGETLHKKYNDYEVPCAVCQSKKRLNVHMIPAKDRCHSYGWHLEYRGYLMTQHYGQGASNYVCVDAQPDKIGSISNQNGRTFYPVESGCGSLPCPPYVKHRELTCAVCTF